MGFGGCVYSSAPARGRPGSITCLRRFRAGPSEYVTMCVIVCRPCVWQSLRFGRRTMGGQRVGQ